jgi:predicted DNA-binding transcriptional regulator YafY
VARRLGLAAAAPAVEGALAKIDQVLPLAVREQVQAVQESLAFDLPRVGSPPDGPTVRAFGAAARQQRRLWIEYGAGSETTARAIDPYGLVYRLGLWYAVGWCHLRQDRRVFRLDRVQRAVLLDERFSRPPDFDCLAYVQQRLGQTPRTWSAEVLLDLTPEAARAAILPEYGMLEPTPTGVLFRCQVDSLERLAWHLLGLSCGLIVRGPPELIEALERLAARAAASAARSRAGGSC